jgi:hypothetical protein
MVGRVAANNGLALFPRRIRGRFTAISPIELRIEFDCIL